MAKSVTSSCYHALPHGPLCGDPGGVMPCQSVRRITAALRDQQGQATRCVSDMISWHVLELQ